MRRLAKRRGFTLVELMMVVAIVGVLASLGTYGVQRYVTTAKTAEALTNLAGISKAVHTAATRETMAPGILAANAKSSDVSAQTIPGLCKNSTSVPSSMKSVKGKKYQARHAAGSDYGSGDRYTGWRCLGFRVDGPQYYRYRYKTNGPPVSLPNYARPAGVPANRTWAASAQGDLDGDGVTSWFVLNGYITSTRQIVQATTVATLTPEE